MGCRGRRELSWRSLLLQVESGGAEPRLVQTELGGLGPGSSHPSPRLC